MRGRWRAEGYGGSGGGVAGFQRVTVHIRFSVLCFSRDAGGIFVLAGMAALKIEFKILARWRGVDLWVERARKW